MKGNSPAGKRCSLRSGFFVVLFQLSFLTSMLTIHVFASLHPYSQSVIEFEAIFNDTRLLESLNGHLMTSVSNDGRKIVIKAGNGGVIRGSIRTIPFRGRMVGARRFRISKLRMVRGLADKAINPRNGEPTSATRLQDFKNLMKELGGAADFEKKSNKLKYIGKIEVLGTNILRISNSMDSDHSMDIHFTPTVYTPPENQLSAL